MRARVGRPSVYSEPLSLRICEHLASGMTLRASAWPGELGRRNLRCVRGPEERRLLHASTARPLEGRRADARVEQALYHRAIGYSYDSERVFCSKDGIVTRVAVVERMAPAQGAPGKRAFTTSPPHRRRRPDQCRAVPDGGQPAPEMPVNDRSAQNAADVAQPSRRIDR